MNKNEKQTYQYLWNTVFREKFIAINAYIKKKYFTSIT